MKTARMKYECLPSLLPTAMRWVTIFVCAVTFLAVSLATVSAEDSGVAGTGTNEDLNISAPEPEIPIPFVTFSPASIEPGSGELVAPWIGDYAAGVYRFLISIVGVVAGVFILIGGFQYLTAGGSAERAQSGKRRIVNALTGLILAYGSYIILYAINPDLVNFEALKLKSVESDPWTTQLGLTTSVTAQDGSGLDAGAAANTYTSNITCPLSRDQWKDSKTDMLAFYNEILKPGIITGTTLRERVIQVANIAEVCNSDLRSCGQTAGTIVALAAKGTSLYDTVIKKSDEREDCLSATSKEFNCNGANVRTKKVIGGFGTHRQIMYGQRCNIDGGTKTLKISGKSYTYPLEDCVDSAAEARIRISTFLSQRAVAGDKALAGWPDSWIDVLQPGDYVDIYNGNRDLTGGHAFIFMGWADPETKSKMQVVQGGGGGSGDKFGKTRGGTWCIRPSCGKSFASIVGIYSVD